MGGHWTKGQGLEVAFVQQNAEPRRQWHARRPPVDRGSRSDLEIIYAKRRPSNARYESKTLPATGRGHCSPGCEHALTALARISRLPSSAVQPNTGGRPAAV